MKNFELTKDMQTMGGVFYPKGYIVLMFPNEADAKQVANEVDGFHKDPDGVMLLSPETIKRELGKVDGKSDIPLTSVGTEDATARKYVGLAGEGHYGLMIKTPSDEFAEQVMVAARKVPFSYGQRYHLLAMEDMA